jgi:hypothetical protein
MTEAVFIIGRGIDPVTPVSGSFSKTPDAVQYDCIRSDTDKPEKREDDLAHYHAQSMGKSHPNTVDAPPC